MCKAGKHNLIVIYSHARAYFESPTVRWCENCGAVVVDMDVDGRTFAGNIMPMRFPTNNQNGGK